MEVRIDKESSNFSVISNTRRGPDHRTELLRPRPQAEGSPVPTAPASRGPRSPVCSCDAEN